MENGEWVKYHPSNKMLFPFTIYHLRFTFNACGYTGDAVIDFITLVGDDLGDGATDVDVLTSECIVGDDTASYVVMDEDNVVR